MAGISVAAMAVLGLCGEAKLETGNAAEADVWHQERRITCLVVVTPGGSLVFDGCAKCSVGSGHQPLTVLVSVAGRAKIEKACHEQSVENTQQTSTQGTGTVTTAEVRQVTV